MEVTVNEWLRLLSMRICCVNKSTLENYFKKKFFYSRSRIVLFEGYVKQVDLYLLFDIQFQVMSS